jgi:hypothetical protein
MSFLCVSQQGEFKHAIQNFFGEIRVKNFCSMLASSALLRHSTTQTTEGDSPGSFLLLAPRHVLQLLRINYMDLDPPILGWIAQRIFSTAPLRVQDVEWDPTAHKS